MSIDRALLVVVAIAECKQRKKVKIISYSAKYCSQSYHGLTLKRVDWIELGRRADTGHG